MDGGGKLSIVSILFTNVWAVYYVEPQKRNEKSVKEDAWMSGSLVTWQKSGGLILIDRTVKKES